MSSLYLAVTAQDFAAARSLFKEYAASININLDFQHFADELNGLNKMYASPFGGIILAKEGETIIGCVAIRKISDEVGELKRMYIKSAYRKKGIGKILLAEALYLAKKCSYLRVKLDTLNNMLPAIHLYKQAGFTETPPYYHNPISTAVYFEKIL